MRMQGNNEKYLKSLIPNLAPVESESGNTFSIKSSITETGAQKHKNSSTLTHTQQSVEKTILPDIHPNPSQIAKRKSEKLATMRKSVDHKSEKNCNILKPKDDVEAMKTIISNYLAVDSKTEGDNNSSKYVGYVVNANNRNNHMRAKLNTNKSLEQDTNFKLNHSNVQEHKRKRSSYSNYPVGFYIPKV